MQILFAKKQLRRYNNLLLLFYFEVDFMKNWKLILAILTANVVLMAAELYHAYSFFADVSDERTGSERRRCKNVERRDFFHNLSDWRHHGAYLG